ncbi:MAG: hypothetical protein HZC24_06295 [Rhodocyclales bacterium]|nr:hypothetical protein [Rhodocyclales bacterium]
MEAQLHWSIWLLAGIGIGILPIFGAERILGLVQGAAVIGSPVVIYMYAGTAFMPYVLFYGALMVVSSFLYRRRTAKENKNLRESIDAKKKRWG